MLGLGPLFLAELASEADAANQIRLISGKLVLKKLCSQSYALLRSL